MSDLWNDMVQAWNGGCPHVLEEILTNKPNLNFRTESGDTPLINAVRNGHYDTTEKLINAGANVNFPDDNRYTALMQAAADGNIDLCQLLLNSHANVNAMCCSLDGAYCHAIGDHWSALDAAATNDHYEIVSLLLEVGATLTVLDPETSYATLEVTPMESAIGKDHPRILELFFEHFDKTGQNVPWEAEFKYALDEEAEHCAIVIIQQGYYPRSKTSYNFSLFKMAAGFGFLKLMYIMIEQNPYFLQEEWLVQNDIYEELFEYESFVSWLIEARREVPPLKQLCKSTILTYMSPKPRPKIKELPLPNMLKAYLRQV